MTAGETLAITGLASGTTVNLLGEVTFGVSNWDGPLFEIGTESDDYTFTFNGNGMYTNPLLYCITNHNDESKATLSTVRARAIGTEKVPTAVLPSL